MEQLTSTTKELIFERILALKEEISKDTITAHTMEQKESTEEFAQFQWIKIEAKELEIEFLKQKLFS